MTWIYEKNKIIESEQGHIKSVELWTKILIEMNQEMDFPSLNSFIFDPSKRFFAWLFFGLETTKNNQSNNNKKSH